MPARTLLLVSYHFPPSAASGSFRLLGFSRHLPRFGWRVVVVAPPRLPWEAVDPELALQVPTETSVYHVRHDLRGPLGLPLKLYAPLVSWLPKAWWACRRAIRENEPAAFLTSGPPHHAHRLGLWLKQFYGIPWVADFRDPWVTGLEAAGGSVPKGRRNRNAAQRLESRVMDLADVVIANTPGACASLQQGYPANAHKMHAIPNGYDPETFERLDASPPAVGEMTIIHPGQLYGGRDPRPFLDAIKVLSSDSQPGMKRFRVKFSGNLDTPSFNLQREIENRSLGEIVSVSGQVPYLQSLREMKQADLLLLLDTPGRRTGVPAKLYEYIGAKRPILALGESDGDLAWVLRQSGLPYRIAPPHDSERIRDLLIELSCVAGELSPAVSTQTGPARFSRENLTAELAKYLDRCSG